ncbi:MAG: autotransporter-associated beta strand repeat-containing protein [Verrucomicrobiota bacterium]
MKRLNPTLLLFTAALFLLVPASPATTRNWTGAGTNSFWTTATNWDSYPSAPAASGDTLVFTAAARQTMTNNYTAITNTMTFANGGWTLNGSNVWLGGTLTSSGGTNVINVNTPLTAARTISVAADQLIMNGVISGAYALTKTGVGTLVLTTNNTYTGGTTIAASTGIVKISNTNALGSGTVTINKAGVVFNGYLQLNLTGANTITNTFSGFSSTTTLGDPTVPCIENLSGTNTLTSPLIVTGTGGNGETFKASGGLLVLAGNLGSSTTSRGVGLNGSGNGLITGAITNGSGNSAFTIWKDGSGTWTLNGTNTDVGTLLIQNGKIALGPNGSISNLASINLAASGSLDVSAVPGGWTLNAGKFIVGNGVVYGNVTIPAATLQPGQIPALYSSAVNQTAGTLSFSNNLTLNGATLTMNLSSDPTGVTKPNDQVVVAGNLTASGANTISLNANPGSVIANGTYHLIKYGGTFTGSSNNFTVANFPTGGRGTVGGYILAGAQSIDLVVTGTPPANLVWRGDGAGNNWDVTTTSNWWNPGSTNLDVFFNNDAVVFDDTATNFIVNLPANVTSGYVAVNSTNNYSFNGGGAITGANGLVKTGSGTLTNNLSNSYTGPTYINGGTLAISGLGAPAVASPVGASANSIVNLVLNGGTLEITGGGETTARDFSVGPNGGTLQIDTAGAVESFSTSGGLNAGVNTFTKTGPGTLTSTFQQVFEGTNYILGGILKIPTVGWFGVNLTTPVFINGGELDLNAQTMSTKPVVVQGMGDPILNANSGTTNGAIINSSATGQNQALQFVTLSGDTAFGGTGRWDIRGNSSAYLSTGGNAYNLVKAGANQISLVSVTVDPALANIDVQSGIFSYELNTTGLGNPNNTLTVESGATLDFWAATTPLNKKIALHDNTTVSASNGVNTIVGPVNLLGDTGGGTTFALANGVSLNVNGVVSGAGNLALVGNGTLTLAATNGYAGTTTVAGGKLVVNSAQTGTGAIAVNDGSTLGIVISGAGQLLPASLAFGSSVGPVTNEFTGVASTTTAPINTPSLAISGTSVINILTGNFLAGHVYPLISFGSMSGTGNFALGTLPPLVTATIITNGNSIALSVSSAIAIEYWTGIVNGNWDINATTNWTFNGASATYANGNTVEFDDTASNTVVTITAPVQPKGIFVNNVTRDYSISGSPITGTNSITKLGTAALTLYSANTYTGGTTLSAGTLNLDNNAALGTGPLTINGGTIDNNGSDVVTLTNNNVQNWNGDFTYTGNQNLNLGTGVVTLASSRQVGVNANTLTVGGVISDGGAGYSLTKAGAGSLTLRGANTYRGVTTVLNGSLDIYGNQSAVTGGYLVGPSNVSSSVVNFHTASTVVVAATNSITVGNTALSGTAAETLNVLGTVVNNGTLFCGRAGSVNINSNGVWTQVGSMTVNAIGGYTGTLTVAGGGSFAYSGPDNILVNPGNANTGSGIVAINGGTFTTSQGFEQTLAGSTGLGLLELLNGGALVLSSNVPQLIVVNTATLILTNGTGGGVIDTAGFATEINTDITGTGSFTKRGAGTLTLSAASPLTYSGNTLITGGSLVLSNSATPASTNILIGGSARLDVSALSTQPFVLADYQVLGNLASTAVLDGSVDAATSPAALSLAYAAGTPALTVLNGALTLAAATLVTVNNTGAALANGTYKLISAGAGGSVAGVVPATVTITGSGLGTGGTAALSLNGNELYLTVSGAVTVNTNSPVLTNSYSSGSVKLSWPADHIGWRLLLQTNHLASGISVNLNDWDTVPNSATTNAVTLPVDATKPTEFYRLVYP